MHSAAPRFERGRQMLAAAAVSCREAANLPNPKGSHPMTTNEAKIITSDRRRFLRGAGIATLSATAIAMLGGREALRRGA